MSEPVEIQLARLEERQKAATEESQAAAENLASVLSRVEADLIALKKEVGSKLNDRFRDIWKEVSAHGEKLASLTKGKPAAANGDKPGGWFDKRLASILGAILLSGGGATGAQFVFGGDDDKQQKVDLKPIVEQVSEELLARLEGSREIVD